MLLYTKGADSVVEKLLHPKHIKLGCGTTKDKRQYTQVKNHIDAYAVEGLRTLILAKRKLDPDFYKAWNDKWTNAMKDIENRDALIDKLSVEIE